jgi:aryl-alcohol dehydrogenase-like predicted oxidoreductase
LDYDFISRKYNLGVRFEILIVVESLMMTENYINLGKTEINISRIGLGTLQWGDIKLPTKQDDEYDKDIQQVFQTTLDSGINFIDTAEVYGDGRSETYLGKYLKNRSDNVVIATKFMPYPWRLTKGKLRSALLRSLKRLGLERVDLYQVHWPFPPVAIHSWMDAMSDAVADGLIRAVGVSNYSPLQTKIAFEALDKHQIPLASNQVKYNLLDRRPERSGLVDLCKKLDITIIAYSPLEKGILTGKYTPNNLPRGLLSWRYNKSFLIKIKPLLDALQEIGQTHTGMTPAKVALNWLVCKSAVPIPGARNMKQAQENAGGLGLHLNDEEVARLDKISDEVSV